MQDGLSYFPMSFDVIIDPDSRMFQGAPLGYIYNAPHWGGEGKLTLYLVDLKVKAIIKSCE